MRKYLLFIVVIIISIGGMAQKKYEREKIIQAPQKSIEDIYNSLKTWFVENAKYDSRNVIQIDDPSGTLMGKASIKVPFNSLTWHAMSGTVTFITDIKIKDGRFKVKFYDFSHQRDDLSVSAQWDQGVVYEEMPEDRVTGLKWKPYRVFSEKAIPLMDEWCESAFNTMEESVNSSIKKEDENW